MARGSKGAVIGKTILDELLCREGSLCHQMSNSSTIKRKTKMTTKVKPGSKPTTKTRSSRPVTTGGSKQRSNMRTDKSSSKRTRNSVKVTNYNAKDQAVMSASKGASRAVYPYSKATTEVYPQNVDMFLYGIMISPAGDNTGSDSLAREHFDSVVGPKLLAAIRQALTYGPTTSLTLDHIADYINTVSRAYFFLHCMREHYRYCFYAVNSNSLTTRFNNIYDESIPANYIKLANALSPMFLPAKIQRLMEVLAKVYYVDDTSYATKFQMVGWDQGYNTSADYVATCGTHISNLLAITNRVPINTAFDSTRFSSDFVDMSPLSLESHRNPDLFLENQPTVSYNEEMLNTWTNLPLLAGDGAGATQSLPLATQTTTYNPAVFGSTRSKLNQALTAKYITADTRHQPGILCPLNLALGVNSNNIRHISAGGNDSIINVSVATQAIPYGVLSRTQENTWDTTNNLQILPSGSTYLQTRMTDIASDTYDVMDDVVN